MDTSLVKFEAARRALAEAKTIDEVKDIRDKAEALRLYVKQQGESLEMQNDIAEIKLRAERRAGELLAEIERIPPNGNRRAPSTSVEPGYMETLRQNDIPKTTATRWQSIAAMPEETFETVISTTKSNGDELTSAGMLRVAKSQGMQVHYSSENDKWNTPPEIIKCVLSVLGEIDLDPCSNDKQHPNVPALHYFTVEDDGLEQDWFGNVYMNPPYGDEISKWTSHLVFEYEGNTIKEAIALLPARTDTLWFQQLKPFARCFIWGRLKFSGYENSAPFPSMVVYFGTNLEKFFKAFRDIGDIYIAVG